MNSHLNWNRFEDSLAHAANRAIPGDLPLDLDLRWPTRLPCETIDRLRQLPIPVYPVPLKRSPRFSIIVLAWNQQPFTGLCIASVLDSCRNCSYELIVIDNGSTDGTADYLKSLSQVNPQVKPIFNPINLGFAAANNQAMDRANGEILVLLNNDTVVAPGWLQSLAQPLEDPMIGMSAPLTNRSGGENEIEVSYRTYGEFLELAQRVSEGAAGPSFDSHMIPMFCVALKRQCWDRVGPLDEQYQLGLFEDDDYCLRVKTAGFRMVVASQCFIHHFGQASMGSADHYAGLFRANRARYERKWGITWERAPRRRSADYLDMIGRLRTMVGHDVPQQVKVAVISRGDEELLKLGNCLTEHFMQDAEGRYAGHHPAHDLEALNRLEELRRRDVKYLLIPKTAFWWLEFYPDFRAHLATSCRLVAQQSGAGLLYQLPPIPNEPNS